MKRLLDLYCGAGGASAGYAAAGFEVTGVDVAPQPRYRHTFVEADALGLSPEFLAEFDAVHASPPCQAYSRLCRGRDLGYPDLVARTRELLERSGRPWVIENVVGAPLADPVTLCGTMFGLRVIRHRLFEATFPIPQPPCTLPHPVVHSYDRRLRHYGRTSDATDFVMVNGTGNYRKRQGMDAMGIDFDMTKRELNQAIPPAYAHFVGLHARFALRDDPRGAAEAIIGKRLEGCI